MVYGALTLASFVYFNSGSRGIDVCLENGYAGPGHLSWWQPGTECTGGEPQITEVYLNTTFVVVPAIVVFLALATWAIRLARDPRGTH
ncbi:hypothetical protein DSM112329_02877 [Paraconexibacter sp. AEG42_29]|uniref:Uncharacterized protein n=1 Tax=Paraconexibacter sp. AEG42_29 TaxID=2997339 RepID=A0AAU7AWA9_9ACTN